MKPTMRFPAPCLLVLLLFFSPARATLVYLADFSGGGEAPVRLINGQSVPNGTGLVRVGYFLNFDAPEFASSLQIAFCPPPSGPQGKPGWHDLVNLINTSFVPLGEGQAGLGTVIIQPGFATRTINGFSQPSRLTGAIADVAVSPAPPHTLDPGHGVPAGSRLFLMIFDGPAMESSTQMGLYSATSWVMPANPTVNRALLTTDIDAPEEIYIGSSAHQDNLDPLVLGICIPEPDGAVLFLIIAALWLARRPGSRS
jgi:hypothetical protein